MDLKTGQNLNLYLQIYFDTPNIGQGLPKVLWVKAIAPAWPIWEG